MILKGSWAIDQNGSLVHISKEDKVSTVISQENEELFLNVNGKLVDPNTIARQRNKVAIKALYLFLFKLRSVVDTDSLSDGVHGNDIPLTKTSVASLVNWMLFNGNYNDMPEYIKEVL